MGGNIKMDLSVIGCEQDSPELEQGATLGTCEHGDEISSFIKRRKSDCQLLTKHSSPLSSGNMFVVPVETETQELFKYFML
jgi:hypothetical protein